MHKEEISQTSSHYCCFMFTIQYNICWRLVKVCLRCYLYCPVKVKNNTNKYYLIYLKQYIC